MDAFFASVELRRRPELRGLPVIIGGRGDPDSRGVVSTASYEARRFGVHSAMPLHRARSLCPDAIFLPVDFDAYKRASRAFKAAAMTVSEQIEDRGIDEIYIDLSAIEGIADDLGAAAGQRLKTAVLEATGLTCSVGVAPNKLLAKLASELDKPDGLTVLTEADLVRRIWPLAARSVNGIGPKADARLQALGIHTIGELAATAPETLRQHFGAHYSQWLHDAAHGRDDRPLSTERAWRSISRESTFDRDLHLRRDWHTVAAWLARFARGVAADLNAKGYKARTIGVKVRYADFRSVTRDLSLRAATDDPVLIRRAAFECLARIPEEGRLRLIGVRASALVDAQNEGAAAAVASASGGTIAGTTTDTHTDTHTHTHTAARTGTPAGTSARPSTRPSAGTPIAPSTGSSTRAGRQDRSDGDHPGIDPQPDLPFFD